MSDTETKKRAKVLGAHALEIAGVALVLALCLFAGTPALESSRLLWPVATELLGVLCDPNTQWIVFACCIVCLAIFTLAQPHDSERRFWRLDNTDVWLIAVVGLAALDYATNYRIGSRSTYAVTLLAGSAIGKGAAAWASAKEKTPKMENEGELARLVLCVLLTLLAMVVVLRTRAGSSFEYRGQVRWSAPWGNPNMFGMLMGTGVTLAAGQALRAWLSADLRTSNAGHRSPGMLWRTIHAALLVFAAVLSGTGLVMSYSRGAWVGTLCGIAYLMWRGVQSPLSEASNVSRSICISGLRRNWLPLSLVFLSLGALAFWSFRQTERAIPRRAFSLANVNDFSWRNRVASWEGALRMIGSKPISGFGWNMQDPVYAELYLSPRLAVGRPIRANDYLTLGATLGVPALVCFIVYVGLSLRSNTLCCAHSVRAETRDNRPRSTESVKMVCRAAVVVLLVGFWFEGADGGLLRLPTGSLFWILSELGRET